MYYSNYATFIVILDLLYSNYAIFIVILDLLYSNYATLDSHCFIVAVYSHTQLS